MRTNPPPHCVVASAICVVVCTAAAQPFMFTRIAGNETQMPDAPSGRRFLLLGVPSISGDRVAFYGEGLDPKGVYEWNAGALVRVADTTTQVPQATGTFVALAHAGSSADHVVFGGNNGTIGGLYHRWNGQLGLIVDTQTTAPNGGLFTGAGSSTGVTDNSVAFFGRHLVSPGVDAPAVYRWDNGIITTVADTNTAVPGGTGNFQDLVYNSVRLNQGSPMFIGRDTANKTGIYQSSAGVLSAAVDTNTDGPAGMGKFTNMVEFDSRVDDIILGGATQTGGGGIYSRVNGQWSRLLAVGDSLPGGGTFNVLGSLTIQGGVSVFSVLHPDNSVAIYTDSGGTLQRIIGFGDTLDGKTVRSAGLGGRDGNRLAITVEFTDNAPPVSYDEAIYTVTIPVPPIGMVPLAGAALLAARSRR